jgi:uncharacterized SAM-binding protein YcdF (DUF218 family)
MFKLIRRVISLIVAVVIIIPTYALFVTWNAAKNPDINTSADAIVVAGAAQLNGAPGDVLLARLEEAKRLFGEEYAPLIITVGAGAPGDRTTEAAAGRYWLIRNGVPKSKVLSIPVGRDTLTQTKSYITEMKKRNLDTVIIATDAYHCNRAITMAKDFDAIASCSPSQSGPNTLEKSRYRYLIREAGAYLSYITLGRRGIHISDHLTNGSLVRYVYDLGK